MPPDSINQSELFVTLGRVEAKVDALGSIDGRLRTVEQDVHTLKEGQNRKAPWWTVVLVVVGVLGGASGMVTTFVLLSQISNAIAASNL